MVGLAEALEVRPDVSQVWPSGPGDDVVYLVNEALTARGGTQTGLV